MHEKVLHALSNVLPEVDFRSSTNFVADGLIDSFDLVLLINELEEMFEFSINGADIIPENFRNVDSIVELINRSRG